MAQQMRVRDQEIIVKKVVKALEEKGLQDLETRFGNDSQVKFLRGELKKLIEIKTKVSELRDKELALDKAINRGVDDFNTANDLDNNNGLKVKTGYGYNKDDNRKVFFDFSIDWSKKTEIADALAMQTLGSDFNVQDLIANLIAEFS